MVFCRGQDLGYYAVNVGFGGAVIYDACSQAELATQRCIGQIHAASLDHAFQDCGVPPVEFVIRVGFVRCITEADGTKLNRYQHFEIRVLVDGGRQMLRQIQILLDSGAENRQPVIAQRKPKSQGAETARKFQRFLKARASNREDIGEDLGFIV